MMRTFSEKKLNKIGRIDRAVRDYFERHPHVKEVAAKDLMKIFVREGIFLHDKSGIPIKLLLRELKAAGKLDLIKFCKVVRKETNPNWYFARHSDVQHMEFKSTDLYI